ncbi:MAG: aminotransferase class I/II-fold pyridoxal phosphate-dependent enzyme [Anaerolineales bacterium]|nr:aminotransferase class I/II-fold pyridoxal phosphate-dependent enzyme [Anaerolineales bacterium]MCB8937900.1 aminotransferase class I/II-fold pyridoxal phosphate-dependent enzyme [Ardenticatenaceae bacterium]
MESLQQLREKYQAVQAMNLKLNMQRGQPSDDDFDLSNAMLNILVEEDLVTPSGIDLRNYPGGQAGLPEAQGLFATVLGVRPSEMIVGNNASLKLMSNTLMWALLRGLKHGDGPWFNQSPKMIVTVPGYDRHFALLDALGFELLSVAMTPDGPDMDAVEKLAVSDPSVKGIMFVPTYSNPTGDTVSDETVRRLVGMKTAAPDFTIFADDAYRIHHLDDGDQHNPLNLLRAAEEAGNPERVILFGSTSKITFAGAGIGFMACSEANVAYITNLIGFQSIGPNKIEQYRHVKFINQYPGGLEGLMRDHAALLRPKFEAVQAVLTRELAGNGRFATWTQPKGGYFVSLDTVEPVADRVVELAKGAGVALTPAGATYPFEKDPHNSNIRLSPSRPPVEEVAKAMEVVALCVKIATLEVDE